MSVHHILFDEAANTHPIAILVPYAALDKGNLLRHYIEPLRANCNLPNVGAYDLEYKGPKAPVSLQKAYLEELLPVLKDMGTTTLLVADGHYFKTLTGQRKSEPHYGYVMPCVLKGYEHLSIVLVPNYKGLFYNPMLQSKIDLALNTLSNFLSGTSTPLGSNIIHTEYYPQQLSSIKQALNDLHKYPKITLDLEAFSLKHYEAGIATCGISWSEHEGISFPVDILRNETHSKLVKQALKEFLIQYQGTVIYHNANFDMKLLCYELWMTSISDITGMLEGINQLTRNFDDTKIISYLALNSTAGNKLSLKEVAHEFAGNWAQEDIKDVSKIPLDKLLRYNLVDCLSTFYVLNKYTPVIIADNQFDLYQNLFKPIIKNILQMELTGMPLDKDQVTLVDQELCAIRDKHIAELSKLKCVQEFTLLLREEALHKDYVDRVKKAKNPGNIKMKPSDAFDGMEFNPNSGVQLQKLLYEVLGYPVIDKTPTKAPATGGKTLNKLISQSKSTEHHKMFEALIGLAEVNVIIDNFISNFKLAVSKGDNRVYLFGSFNLGGTVTGRLSSSAPNLQNIPSTGSKYAKHIKKCFSAPDGWFMVGADFASLEDRISALTTKDTMKLKVYTDGYDGHSLRAFSYFGENMPDIDPNIVNSINSIGDLYPDYRQLSKIPTFALTYGGTYIAIMEQTGMAEKMARSIEKRYHELYIESDRWVQSKIKEACNLGYVTVAFGLRLRTPILSQTILNTSVTPYEAQKEARTAGNALGQSYGLLNSRAGVAIQEKVLASPYAEMILPIAHIHDAQYFLVKDDIDALVWLNNELVKEMKWQELPELHHDLVKLGGNLEIYYPTWANKCVVPNGASANDIRRVFQNVLNGLNEDGSEKSKKKV